MGKRSESHIKKTLKLLPLQRYQYSIREILEDQRLYLLEREADAYAVSKFEDKTILAMWPAEEYATHNAVNDWSDFVAKEVKLADLEPILDSIEDMGWSIDMFPVDNKTGYLVTIEEFINDLNSASKSLV